MLLRQPVIISLRGKNFVIYWQTKEEEKVGALKKTEGKKNTDWKDKSFSFQRNAAPISLNIRNPGERHWDVRLMMNRPPSYTGHFWVGYCDQPACWVFLGPFSHRNQNKLNKFQSIYNVTNFIKIFRVANKAPRKREPQSEDSDPFYEVTPLQLSLIGPLGWQQSSLTCPSCIILGM